MGDAGEGLIDAEARIQERMEEVARQRAEKKAVAGPQNTKTLQELESLRLARAEMQRQFDLIAAPMQEDTQKPYSNADFAAERDRLLAFPAARITFVRCEVARQTGTAVPAGCP